MQTFDQALYQLYSDKHLSKTTVLEYAGSRNDLEWQINFGTTEGKGKQADSHDFNHGLPEMA